MKTQKGFAPILLIILVSVTLGIVGIYLYDKTYPIKQYSTYTYAPLRKTIVTASGARLTDGQTQTIESSVSAVEKLDQEWVEYTNQIDGYSFLYPKNWHLKECSNGKYMGNISLSPSSMDRKQCVAETREEAIEPLISVFAVSDMTVEQLIEDARSSMGLIADFIEKTTEINSKPYKQMLSKLKIIPPWAIPSTTGVTTFIEVPERKQVINIGLAGLDDDSKNANIYRQIILSFKTADTQSEAVYCAQDAMECPDGSFVGRVPPKCEFAKCPAGETTGDSGKACQDNSECQGLCLAPDIAKAGEEIGRKGRCSSNSYVTGCRSTISKGMVTPKLCVE